MPLDVWVGASNKSAGHHVASFKPEAYYAFIEPICEEVLQPVGKMIDQYDNMNFNSSELFRLLDVFARAEALILKQPKEFDVDMGTNLGSYREPKNEKIFHRVKRADILDFVRRLKSIVTDAQLSGKSVSFVGD
jgi:hypothetical protein